MFFFVFIPITLLLCFFCGASNVEADFSKDYYWRDFDDVIPNDALIAGKAQDGTQIYIGQVFHENKLIPGPIYSSENRVEFEIKEHNELNEPIKILCTEHPEKFIWAPTTINNILFTTRNGILFVGGYEKGYITFIGRIILDGVPKVEKIICQLDSVYSGYCNTLASLEGRYWMRLSTFEILTLDDTRSLIEIPTTNQDDSQSIPTTTKYSKINGVITDYYCWRDFIRVVPRDALIVGKARDGTPIYLGQVLYNNKLIPGKIYHNSSQIHIEFKAIDVLDESVKILCTKYPEKFVWVPTTTNETFSVQNKHILIGGYENGKLTYVGRTILHGKLAVGKVICTENSFCIPLTIIEANKRYDFYTFEILTFDATSSPIMVAKLTTTEVPSEVPNGPINSDNISITVKDSNTHTDNFDNTISNN